MANNVLPPDVIQQLNEAWLHVDRPDSEIINPFEILRTDDPDEFHKKLTFLMMNPEFLHFTCKHILNIELLPFQALFLQEMWNRKFPMLIASRGAGKTFLLSLYSLLRALFMPGRKIVIAGAAFRQSKFLHEYMENIWKNAPILRDICDGNSGPRRDVDVCRMRINDSIINSIPIGDGCCTGATLITGHDGFLRLDNPPNIVWGNESFRKVDYPIDNGFKPTKVVTTKKGYHYEGTYNHAMKVLRDGIVDWVRTDQIQIGDRILIDRSPRWHNGDFDCTEDEAYMLGAMIGDGCWTDQYSLSFATTDQEIINRINKACGNKFTKRSDGVHWSYACQYYKADWLNFWGLKDKCYAKDKSLPPNILKAPQSKMTACLQGLYDTDGHVFVDTSRGGTTISVNFTNTSKTLVEQMQYILLHYGIVSTLTSRDRNEKWNRVYELGIYGKNVKIFAEQINFRLPRKRDKLNNAVSQKKRWNSFDDDIPLDSELVAASLDQSKKIPSKFMRCNILARKSFQQNYLADLLPYCKDPDWGDLVNPNIFYDTVATIEDSECHTYDIHVPEGNEYCANGFFSHNSKIRGLRANDIICVSKETLVQTDKGLIQIQNYLDGKSYTLMNRDGQFEKPSYILVTDPADVYEVTTRNGYSFKCSHVHQVLTNNGWKKCIDLTPNDYLEIDCNPYFPAKPYTSQGITVDEDLGWLLGILLSEGELHGRNFISVTNTDRDLIDRVISRTGLDWKEYHRPEYTDQRGFTCRESWTIKYNCTDWRETLYKIGVNYSIHKDKQIPSCIMQSSRSVIVEFLKGLFEGDGTSFQFADTKRGNKQKLRLAYYSRSKELCQQLQVLLLKFGVYSALCNRQSKLSKHPQWVLQVNGESAVILHDLLLLKKWNIDRDTIHYSVRKPNIRKNGSKYVVSTYSGNKNIHIGTFDTIKECETAFGEYWCNNRRLMKIKSVVKLPDKEVLYDFHMPETHSFIGNGFVQHNCDEFASMSRDIFENVIAGFAAVSASPAENHRIVAALDKARELGYDPSVVASCLHNTNGAVEAKGNQIILSGTAYYDFNHFAEYWKKWKVIIETGGDQHKLSTEVFAGGDVPENFKWDDYSIIRVPFELIPKGFMDEAQVARSKATIHNGIYLMEFGALFAKDSQGFFKRSLIESCVGTDTNPVNLPSGSVFFDPMLIGNPNCKYVMGVDPASEVDNFSIVIIECHSDHRRIVHCWTTTRKEHSEMVRRGLTHENNFYSYCARKIRQLMSRFNIVHIALDAQGGGIAVSEALHDTNQLEAGELPIWPTIDPDKEKPTDGESGLHILELCQFAKYDWYSEANHGMRKDFEDRVLLFPRFDPVTLGLSIEEDKAKNRLYDTLEDCVMDIEELKNELSLIEITQSVNGRDRWDTPEVKVGVGKKERMRKDRYSALLMANMASRIIANTPSLPDYQFYGGFASVSNKKQKGDQPDFTGPAWFVEQMRNVY